MSTQSMLPICQSIKSAIAFVHYDVLPEKRMGGYGVRLMKAFEQWCKNRKVVEINFGINSADNATELVLLGQFAARLGHTKVGESYARGMATHA